jgi:hypothetical protein
MSYYCNPCVNPCAPTCAPSNVCCRSVCIKTRDKCGKKHKEYIQVCDGSTGPTGPTGPGGAGVGVATTQTSSAAGSGATPLAVAFGTTAVGAGNFPSAQFSAGTYTAPTTGLYNIGVGVTTTATTFAAADTMTTNLLVGGTVIRSATNTYPIASGGAVANYTFSETIAADLYLTAGQAVTVTTVGSTSMVYTVAAGTGTYLNVAFLSPGVPT